MSATGATLPDKVVDAGDGRIISFPGDMPDERIAATLNNEKSGKHFLAERDPANQKGFVGSAWYTAKNMAGSIPKMLTRPYDAFEESRAAGHGVVESLLRGAATEAPGYDLLGDAMQYRQRRAEGYGPIYSAFAPSAARSVGVNLSGMEHQADVGNTEGVAAEAAVPAAAAAIGYGASKIPLAAARDAIGSTFREPSGALTKGAELTGRVGGAIAGGAAGTLTHTPYGPLGGAFMGARYGPSLMDALLPEHPYVRALNEFGLDPSEISTSLTKSPNMEATAKIGAFRRAAAKEAASEVPTGQSRSLSDSPYAPRTSTALDFEQGKAGPFNPVSQSPNLSPSDIASAYNPPGRGGKIVLPGSEPPPVNRTLVSYDRGDLVDMVKDSDTPYSDRLAAIRELRRSPGDVPREVISGLEKYMVEPGAKTRIYGGPKR